MTPGRGVEPLGKHVPRALLEPGQGHGVQPHEREAIRGVDLAAGQRAIDRVEQRVAIDDPVDVAGRLDGLPPGVRRVQDRRLEQRAAQLVGEDAHRRSGVAQPRAGRRAIRRRLGEANRRHGGVELPQQQAPRQLVVHDHDIERSRSDPLESGGAALRPLERDRAPARESVDESCEAGRRAGWTAHDQYGQRVSRPGSGHRVLGKTSGAHRISPIVRPDCPRP